MKKTFNINVAGFAFTIDDDAYTLLNDYINTIERAFSNNEDSQELITDIESRVAELLLECTNDRSPIITAEDVTEVIRRIGKPEEMVADDETISISGDNNSTNNGSGNDQYRENVTPPPYVPPIRKKLYRDPQTGMLGGVCSGIAWYLNCDPTWVRLATVIITLLSFSVGAIAYIILWIVLPEPRTPLDKMSMMGEQPTVENIGKTVTDNFKEEKGEKINDPRANASPVADGMARTFGLVARIFIIIGLIIGIPILISLAIGLLGCVFVLIMMGTSILFGTTMPWGNGPENEIIKWAMICGIGGIFAIGTPIFFLVRKGMSKKPLSSTTNLALCILCAAGFLTAAVATGAIISEKENAEKSWRESVRYEYHSDDNPTEWIDESWEQSTQPLDTVGDSASKTVKTDSLKTTKQ